MKKPRQPDPETVVRVIPKRWRANDCAIWSLSVLTGKPYDDVLIAATQVDKEAGRNGLEFDDIVRVARKMGVRLRRKKPYDLQEDTGLLGVFVGKKLEGHAVVLKQGQIIDVDATVWDAEDYLKIKQSHADELLIVSPPTKRIKRATTAE